MTSFQRIYFSSSLALLGLSQAVFAQSGLDMLQEADAREAAYKYISAAEERFDCEIEEHSMQKVGYRPETLYLFRLSIEGDECNDALIFLTNMAARDGKLLFRQLIDADYEIVEPMVPDSQILIHEVNPGDEERKP